MRSAGRLIRVVLPAVAGLASACGRDPGPVDEPGRRALSLFDLARVAEPDESSLGDLIELGGDDRLRASLLDALDRLPESGRPQVLRVDALEPLGRLIVEVSVGLAGHAEERYTVQLESGGQGPPLITAFDGPGVSWPPRRRSGGPGLTSWPEP